MDKHMILLLAIMAITLAFFRANDYRENRKICIVLVTAVMTLFSGLRTWWMGDLIKYYTQYRQCNAAGWEAVVFEDLQNIGLRLFFRMSGALGLRYEFCIFSIAAFSAITLGILVFRYSPAPYWSYLMYIAMGFYMFTYSGLKQTVAMGFLMLAMIGILESKPKKFLLWVILAGAFHAPALIFIISYPVAKKKIDRMYIAMILAAAAGIFVFRDQIVSWLTSMYYENEAKYSAAETVGGRMLMMIFIICVGLILRPARRGDERYCQILNLMVVAALIQYFSVYNNGFTRLADYYYQFIVLFMPMMLESGGHQMKNRSHTAYRVRSYNPEAYVLLYVGVTVFALWFYNRTINGSQLFLQDYKFIWEIDPYALYGS